MENYKSKIERMYFEHDHPEVKGKTNQEIWEYNLGHDYEEARRRNNELEMLASTTMLAATAAVICCS